MGHVAHLHFYLHIILVPSIHCPLETGEVRDTLYQNISEALKRMRSKPYAINGTRDHVHIACTGALRVSLDDFTDRIKSETESALNDSKLMENFRWQEGYFAVSQEKVDMKNLISYIRNQDTYHRNMTFRDEFILLLDKNKIEYDSKDLFDFHA